MTGPTGDGPFHAAKRGRRFARAMRGRPFHLAVGCFAAGLGVSVAGPALAVVVAVAAFATLACCRAPRLGALGGALLLTGAAIGDARLAALDRPLERVRTANNEPLRAHLVTPPRRSALGSSAEIEVSEGQLAGTKLLLRVPQWSRLPAGVAVGDELVVRGRLRSIAAGGGGTGRGTSGDGRGRAAQRRSGGFDFAGHLRRRGIAGELLLDCAARTGRSRGGVAGILDAMRRRAERAVAAGLPPPEAALARGMVLGQDEEIGEATRQDWRDSGLAHLLAVSGQNVMLLVALALPLLVLARVGPAGRGAGLLALVALYVPLAGAGPSLQRAGVMGAAGIAAMMLSRPASRWYALVLAAAATLVLNPRASGDPGWQLSFVAVAGILIVGRPLADALARAGSELLRRPDRPLAGAVIRGVAEGIAITVAATLATAPLVAFHFGAVPLSGLLANLLALPAVAPVMWLGMVKGALGLAGAIVPPADAIAETLGPVTRLPLAYLGRVAERCADMPGSRLALPLASPVEVFAAYAGLGLAIAVAARAWRRLGVAERPGRSGLAERAAAWRRAPRPVRAGGVAVALLVVGLATSSGLGSPSPPGELTVRFLDVGQGDATLIQHPDGTAVLFDGGPPEGGVTRLLRRAGVGRLAVVVATHASRDHHGGLADVLARYSVGVLLDGGDGNPDPGLDAIRAAAARHGTRRVPAIAPLTLRVGALEIVILSPPPRPPGPAPEDPNPRAVVALVSAGAFDLLLSADAESDALLPLDLPDVEAMKVPHHGSSDPGLPAVLDSLRPEIAAIEVGPNTYGHPAPSTLTALERADVTTYRTDRDGTVTLTVADGRMRVETEH